MAEEKSEGKKGYTFLDKRGLNKGDETDVRPRAAHDPGQVGPEGGAGRPSGTSARAEAGQRSPSVDFITLVMSLASAAMVSMGKAPDPMTRTVQKNLNVAKQNIDIIALLKEKTRGNLTPEEERVIDSVLYELRLGYVEAMRGS